MAHKTKEIDLEGTVDVDILDASHGDADTEKNGVLLTSFVGADVDQDKDEIEATAGVGGGHGGVTGWATIGRKIHPQGNSPEDVTIEFSGTVNGYVWAFKNSSASVQLTAYKRDYGSGDDADAGIISWDVSTLNAKGTNNKGNPLDAREDYSAKIATTLYPGEERFLYTPAG